MFDLLDVSFASGNAARQAVLLLKYRGTKNTFHPNHVEEYIFHELYLRFFEMERDYAKEHVL